MMDAISQPADICILIGSHSVDTAEAEATVVAAAGRLGIIVREVASDIYPGTQIFDAIDRSISEAAIIVVLLGNKSSPYSWFELGVAMASRRPVIIVRTSVEMSLPAALAGVQTIGPLLSLDAMERVLRHTQSRDISRDRDLDDRAGQVLELTGRPLGDRADDLMEDLHSQVWQNGPLPGRLFEDWFERLIAAAHVPHDRESKSVRSVPDAFNRIDFVASADELDGNLGSPIPIELLIGNSINKTIRARSGNFRHYLAATGASTLLVVAARYQKSPALVPIENGNVLVVSARDLVQEMRLHTFGQALLRLRNSAAHREF